MTRSLKSEAFDGTSWATGNSMNTAMSSSASSATTNGNAIIAYGETNAVTSGDNKCETFDGTSWASASNGSYSTRAAGQGCGDSTDPADDFFSFGGYSGATPDPDRLFASNFQSGTWTDLSDLPSNRTSPSCMYVSATEVYAWSGHDGANYQTDGIVWDGVSFATATGTCGEHYGGVGGANIAP